jgi:hypothetical protein
MSRSVYWSSSEVLVILARFWRNFNFFPQIFKKYSNIIFQENPSSCSMWTDGQTRRSIQPLSTVLRRRLKSNKFTGIKCVVSCNSLPTRIDRSSGHHPPTSQCLSMFSRVHKTHYCFQGRTCFFLKITGFH